jgi:RHS repeat-associated protein
MRRPGAPQPGLASRAESGTPSPHSTTTELGTTVSSTPASVNATNQFAGSVQAATGTPTFTVVATDPSSNTRTNTYQVTVSGSPTSFTYDPNGNMTGDGTKTYQWDAENRLVAVLQGAATIASFAYDGKGRRTQKTAGAVTHLYVYEGPNIIEERIGSTQTLDYVQGPDVDQVLAQRDQSATVSYYLADHLGSIVQTTNISGAVTLTREYDPWGNLLQGGTTAGYAFTGREWDAEIGRYYYRARYYDAQAGRFISEDPIGLKGGTNFYGYVFSTQSCSRIQLVITASTVRVRV